jgi:hypothetical protein
MPSKVMASYLFDAVKKIDLKAFVENEAKVSLAPMGKNKWMGVCPLHGDTNPSFSVILFDNGGWGFKCFGCQESGTIIDFCIQYFSMANAWEAVLFIAEKQGIKCDSSIIVNSALDARVQMDTQFELNWSHFRASESCRHLIRKYSDNEEIMLWVAKKYAMMNKMLDDEISTPEMFDKVVKEVQLKRAEIEKIGERCPELKIH